MLGFIGCDTSDSSRDSRRQTDDDGSSSAAVLPTGSGADEYCGDPSLETGTAPLRSDSASGDYLVEIEQFTQPVPSNEIFSLRLRITAAEGIPLQDVGVRVDAAMPHHGHGMTVVPRSSPHNGETGLFEISGMMFHMPGAWELYVDISDGPYTERVTFDVQAK